MENKPSISDRRSKHYLARHKDKKAIAAAGAKKEDATTTAAGSAFGAPPSTAPGFRQLNVHPPIAPFGGGAAPTSLVFGTNTNIAPAFGISATPATSAW